MSKDRIHALVKELRREASGISVKKLMKLDPGDRALIETELESINNRIIRVQEIANARCSVVLETLEHLGGTVRTSSVPRKQ